MNSEQINAAIKIADKLQYFFMATADPQGVPHVATAGQLAIKAPNTLELSFWFCPKTIDNLQRNKKVALIIWDAQRNAGYQLLGRAEDALVVHDADGDGSGEEEEYKPQTTLSLIVHVDTVMGFIHALHNDIPL